MESEVTTTEVAPSISPETSTTQAQQASGVETSQETVSGESKQTSADGTQTPTQEYKPNYKIKLYDQEKEIDDPFLKSLMKDPESEKKVRDLAERVMAFNTYKERHEKLKTDYSKYSEQTQPVVTYYQQAQKMLQNGDLDSFFEHVGIPTQAIYQYAVQKAKEAELDPATQNYLQQQRQIAKQKEYLETQNQTLLQQQQEQMSEFRRQELEWTLAKPDIAQVVQAVDAKNGPGSFKQLVVEAALAHFAQTQGREDLNAQQAVAKVMKHIGAFVTPTTTQVTQPSSITPDAKPVIPNVSGKGTSPVKKGIRSLNDLKNLAKEKLAQQ